MYVRTSRAQTRKVVCLSLLSWAPSCVQRQRAAKDARYFESLFAADLCALRQLVVLRFTDRRYSIC